MGVQSHSVNARPGLQTTHPCTLTPGGFLMRSCPLEVVAPWRRSVGVSSRGGMCYVAPGDNLSLGGLLIGVPYEKGIT